jgi:serine protease Do
MRYRRFRSKPATLAVAAAAFACGLLVASGMDWTTPSRAATLFQAPAAPGSRRVQPVADLNQAFVSIAQSVTPAVVSIETERAARRAAPGNVPQELRELFHMPDDHPAVPEAISGSGFIISPDGYVVTNNHVVANATHIQVVLADNRQLTARLVGRDPNTDIAVIKVAAAGLPTVRFASSEDSQIGEWVLAIGNPLDLGTTVTSGIISAKGRALNGLLSENTGSSQWAIEDFIQTDAPINPGNSGGPLVNLRGEVVGVNTAIASVTGYYAGYGFAVPIDLGKRVADDLIRYGKVRRPALGVSVTEVTPEDADVFRLARIQGVVAQYFPGASAAKHAGMRQGDVIVGVNGRAVEHVGQFQRLVAANRPGDRVSLDVVRYGERLRLEVALGEAPAQGVAAAEETRGDVGGASPGRLGVTVTPATAQVSRALGYSDARGLIVTAAAPAGPAYRAGVRKDLRILAVDGRDVSTPAEFRDAVARHAAGQVVSLRVDYPDGQSSIVNIRLSGG